MPQATPASIPQITSVQEAAAQIVALVNSSPRSPRQDEIEVILSRIPESWVHTRVQCSRCLAPPSPTATAIRELIPQAQKAEMERIAADTDAIREKRSPKDCLVWQEVNARCEALDARLDELASQLWEEEQSLDRLIALAQIAQHHACDWPDHKQDGLTDPAAYCERAFADLTMAVLDYAGLDHSVDTSAEVVQ